MALSVDSINRRGHGGCRRLGAIGNVRGNSRRHTKRLVTSEGSPYAAVCRLWKLNQWRYGQSEKLGRLPDCYPRAGNDYQYDGVSLQSDGRSLFLFSFRISTADASAKEDT